MKLKNDVAEWDASKGYINKVTLKDGRTLVFDPISEKASINDPLRGGLGCFGVCVAERNEHFPRLDQVYNWTWDITGKLRENGYGAFKVAPAEYEYRTKGEAFATVGYEYEVEATSIIQRISIDVVKPIFFKEPKIVTHSILGNYRWLDVFNPLGDIIGPSCDLYKLKSPEKQTFQMPHEHRRSIKFSPDVLGALPKFQITCMRQLEKWAQIAQAGEPISTGNSPHYCLDKTGRLKSQWESAHHPGIPVCGVMFHAWEGGAGQPDCWNCYRLCQPFSVVEVMIYELQYK